MIVMEVPEVVVIAPDALSAKAPPVAATLVVAPVRAMVPDVERVVAEVADSDTDATLMSSIVGDRRRYLEVPPSSMLMEPVLALLMAAPVLITMLPLVPPVSVPAPVAI